MKVLILLVVALILTISCHRNRLKGDEDELAKEILTQEQQLEKERIDREK